MVSSQGLERYRRRQRTLSQAVQRTLARFFSTLDLSDPAAARDALLGFTPELVHRFGPVSAEIAAEWYEEQRRDAGAGRTFRADAASDVIATGQVQEGVRYQAGTLWTPQPADILAALSGNVGKWVRQYGRDTIASNAEREGVAWARVPTGPKTCTWCLILASRDAAYASQRTALYADDGGKYHGECDCEAVRIAKPSDYPSGYLPDDYLAMYEAARDDASSGEIEDIAASMRRMFPDAVNDGVHVH